MKSPPSQERIVFFLFQPIRRARAFLIAGGHVARRRFAQRFGFGAFQRDDFLSHVDNLFAKHFGVTLWCSRPAPVPLHPPLRRLLRRSNRRAM
jgi:hypothetical protein